MSNLATHLAFRYIRKRRIAWLAMITCTLCVALPVAITGIMQGFLDMSDRQLLGAESDLVVKSYNHFALPYEQKHQLILESHENVRAAAPYIKTYAVVSPVSRYGAYDDRANTGCQLEGIDFDQEQEIDRLSASLLHKRPNVDLSAAPLAINERGSGFLTPTWRAQIAFHGSQLFNGLPGGNPIPLQNINPPPGVILGHEFIYTNGLNTYAPGQLIRLIIPNNKGGVLGKVICEISDTIGTGFYEFDRYMAVLPLDIAQFLTDMDRTPSEISGYRIRLHDSAEDDSTKHDLLKDDAYGLWHLKYSVLKWDELSSVNLVKNVEVQRNITVLIMALIQMQCIFIVYAVFSTLVSEKRNDIGILLGIGSSRSSILNAFIWASVLVSLIGGVCGWILAWLFLAILNPFSEWTGLALFPQDIFYTPEAPISWDIRIPLMYVGSMVLIGFLSALIPAYRASRIMPLESIREAQ